MNEEKHNETGVNTGEGVDDLRDVFSNLNEVDDGLGEGHHQSASDASSGAGAVNALEEEVRKYKDLYMRSIADFDNFKKQKERQFVELLKYAEEPVIKDMIPVLDDFVRALKLADGSKTVDVRTFAEGMRLIEQKFMKALESRGVSRIEALGKKLDVKYHEALTQIEKEGTEPETIIEVFEEGYQLHDKVIRHAKVVVAK